MCLSKKESREINEQEGEKKMLLIKRSSKLEYRYRLVVRPKAIKYKKNFLCYLASTASLHLYSPKT